MTRASGMGHAVDSVHPTVEGRPRHVLRLFVAGETPHGQRATRNLRVLCGKVFGSDYDLDIIDILREPDAAEAHRIMATPTLIKLCPLPRRILIGDMSDTTRVLHGLDLPAHLPDAGELA